MFILVTYNLLDADLIIPTGDYLDIHLPANTEVFELQSSVFYTEPPGPCMIWSSGSVDRTYTATDKRLAIVTRNDAGEMTRCSVYMEEHEARLLNLWAIDNDEAMREAFASLQ